MLRHEVTTAKTALTKEQCKSERLVNEASEASKLHNATKAALVSAHVDREVTGKELESAKSQHQVGSGFGAAHAEGNTAHLSLCM